MAATFENMMQRLENYASSSVSASWNSELLTHTLTQWGELKTQTRRKILTSFFYMKNPHHLKQCENEMNQIILEGTKDRSDEWVRSLSRLLEGFPSSGRIDYWKVDGELLYKTNEDIQGALSRYDGLYTTPFHLKKKDWNDELSLSESDSSSEEYTRLTRPPLKSVCEGDVDALPDADDAHSITSTSSLSAHQRDDASDLFGSDAPSEGADKTGLTENQKASLEEIPTIPMENVKSSLGGALPMENVKSSLGGALPMEHQKSAETIPIGGEKSRLTEIATENQKSAEALPTVRPVSRESVSRREKDSPRVVSRLMEGKKAMDPKCHKPEPGPHALPRRSNKRLAAPAIGSSGASPSASSTALPTRTKSKIPPVKPQQPKGDLFLTESRITPVSTREGPSVEKSKSPGISEAQLAQALGLASADKANVGVQDFVAQGMLMAEKQEALRQQSKRSHLEVKKKLQSMRNGGMTAEPISDGPNPLFPFEDEDYTDLPKKARSRTASPQVRRVRAKRPAKRQVTDMDIDSDDDKPLWPGAPVEKQQSLPSREVPPSFSSREQPPSFPSSPRRTAVVSARAAFSGELLSEKQQKTSPSVLPTEVCRGPPSAIVPTEVCRSIPSAMPTEVCRGVSTATPTEVPRGIPSAMPIEVCTRLPSAMPAEVSTRLPSCEVTEQKQRRRRGAVVDSDSE